MIIDKKGNIQLENLGLILTPGFTIDDLNNCPAKNAFIFKGTYGDWVSYSINPLIIHDCEFAANIGFKKNTIATITMVLIKDEKNGWERKGKDWDSWSLQEEKEVNKIHHTLVGLDKDEKSKEFEWGSIYSGYDNISGFSSITIRFKKELKHKKKWLFW